MLTLTGGVLQYIEKRPDVTVDRSTATEIYVRSRGVVILPMIRNILEDPVVGIGFGVPSSRENVARTDRFLGIPTSAPVGERRDAARLYLKKSVFSDLAWWVSGYGWALDAASVMVRRRWQ